MTPCCLDRVALGLLIGVSTLRQRRQSLLFMEDPWLIRYKHLYLSGRTRAALGLVHRGPIVSVGLCPFSYISA